MSADQNNPDDFQRVNPEDYLDFEDRYIEKGGGGGKSAGSGKGKKTLKAIKSQAKKSSAADRKRSLESKLKKTLKGIQAGDEERIAGYLLWVNANLGGRYTLGPDELEISFARSGGPGGQNVNKRETKVILTHIPTGFQVASDRFRTQAQNREDAESKLEVRLEEHLADWRMYLGSDHQLEFSQLEDILD